MNRSPDGPHTSERSFDESFVDKFPFFDPVVISKWSEAVPGVSTTGEDLFPSLQGFQDMNTSDLALQKDDNASVSSTMVDSSYGSLPSNSRRGTAVPENYQAGSPQENRNQVEEQYFYSPSLSSDTYSSLPGAHQDMSQMFLPATSEPDMGESGFSYANFPSTQGYGQFSHSAVTSDIAPNWATPNLQLYNQNFNMNQMRQSQPFTFPSQESSEFNFQHMLQPQRPVRKNHLDALTIPGLENLRTPSVHADQHDSRNTSSNDATFASFVMSPVASHPAASTENDFEHQHFPEFNPEKDEPLSTRIDHHNVQDDELSDEPLSPGLAAQQAQHEDAQGRVARTDPLYQAHPGPDDLYHCPNEGQPGCNHKPTKLKCNYDKYVDSHLRPFRCKDKGCVGVQFSSTACLLRHEREAHGLHGHGSKPHLCTYPDCERSVIGNGFPRRYNLFDHMKRVHDYTPSTSPTSPTQQGPPEAKRQPRKRKATTEEGGEKRQKTAKPSAQAVAAHQLNQKRNQLQAEFNILKDSLVNTLTNMADPKELNSLQLNEDALALQKISAQLKGLG